MRFSFVDSLFVGFLGFLVFFFEFNFLIGVCIIFVNVIVLVRFFCVFKFEEDELFFERLEFLFKLLRIFF